MVSVQAELAAAQQVFTLNNSSAHLEAQARGFQMPASEEWEAPGVGGEPYAPPGYVQVPQEGGPPLWPAQAYQPLLQPPFQQQYPPPPDTPQRFPYYVYS